MKSDAVLQRRPLRTGGPGGQKRILDPPTNLGDVFLGVTLQLCRKYLFVNISIKIAAYAAFVFFGSLIADHFPFPRNFYLVQKDNIFNQYFVKLGWGWTLMLTGAFVVCTAQVYSCGNRQVVQIQCLRLAVGTLIWYAVTSFFVRVERTNGNCSIKELSAKGMCVEQGGRWLGFDISGHCFLLVFMSLLISEESKVFRNWDRIRSLLERANEEPPELNVLSLEDQESMRRHFFYYTPYVRVLFVALGALHGIWDLMLFITTLYYHSFPHKVIALCFAILCWTLTYGLWYRTDFSPGLPGQASRLRYAVRRNPPH